jgi:hypothetical protein
LGCDTTQPGAINLDVEITAVEAAPDALGGWTVSYTVTNVGETAVWLARCGDRLMVAVDVRAAVAWNEYSGDGCRAIYDMSPWELAPGATLSGSRRFQEGGRYRFRLGTVADPAETFDWTVASPPFVVP